MKQSGGKRGHGVQQYYPVPPDVNLGRALFPNQMSDATKMGMFGMLKQFGGELVDISRSEYVKPGTFRKISHESGADINDIGYEMERVMANAPVQQQHAPAMQMGYVQGNAGMPVVQQPVNYNMQNMQNYNNFNNMNEDDISKYIGGGAHATQNSGGTTVVEFSQALKPLEKKAEMICQLLGRIYQVETDTNAVVKGLGEQIADSISATMESYMTSGEPVPSIEEIADDGELEPIGE